MTEIVEATAEGEAATTGGLSIGGRALYSGDALNSFSVALVRPLLARYFLSAE